MSLMNGHVPRERSNLPQDDHWNAVDEEEPERRLLFTYIPICLLPLGCWILKWIDVILSFFGIKIYKVTIDNILDGLDPDARAQALHPDIQQPLSLLLHGIQLQDSLDLQARLTELMDIRHTLERRARIERCLQKYPDINKTPTKQPLLIVGFPRSGTTMLHHLLAQDPQFEAPMMWQLYKPFRPGRPDNWKEDTRYIRFSQLVEMWRVSLHRGMDQVHKVHVAGYEECVLIFMNFFFQVHQMVRAGNLDGLTKWFSNLNPQTANRIYKYHKQVLQMIAYGRMDDRHFLLKSHVHLMNMDALMHTFPDAKLVFTHRKLTDLVPSYCSMSRTFTQAWGEIEPGHGKRALDFIGEFGKRMVKFLEKYEDVPQADRPFQHIDYVDLTEDPIGTVRQLYRQLNYTLTPETEERMLDWLNNNPQNKHGRHSYSAAQYSLSNEEILNKCKPYLDYFKDQQFQLI